MDEWNSLPESVVNVCTVHMFKVQLDRFMGDWRYEH